MGKEYKPQPWLSKIGSRKFLGFMIATVALFAGKFDPEWWIAAFAIYVGGNVFQKINLVGRDQYNVGEDTERG
ncbi:MAG: hypothetical protein HPY52_11000 [Firmicutes bacterium]|nr:hypothetical protein [Bacillota bacterium]